MKKNNKNILILVTLIFILIFFLLNTNLVIDNIINYTNTFILKLFPVSFIIYLLVYMLIEYNLIQILNNKLNIKSCNLFIFILSFISGFPSGAKYTKLLYDKEIIKKEYANILIKFCHFPNILFVLGTIKNIINNSIYTYYILLSLIISNFIILLFSKKEYINIDIPYSNKSFSNILSNGIIYSIKTLILIYGTSLFFYLINIIVFKNLSSNLYLYVFFNGFFDLTNGVVNCGLINNIFIKCIFILLFLSFGSISIHIQVIEILGDDINYFSFLKGRIIGTILALIIFIFLFII